MNNKQVTTLLLAKENHYLVQQQLLKQYQQPIITINLNIPGVNKQQKIYQKFFSKVKNDFLVFLKLNRINYQFLKEINDVAGSFLIIVLQKEVNCLNFKKQLIEEELKNPSYQLVDIDLYDEKNHKISRSELNYPLKKCYLCSNSAKLCARIKNHPLDLLLLYLNKVIIQIFDIK